MSSPTETDRNDAGLKFTPSEYGLFLSTLWLMPLLSRRLKRTGFKHLYTRLLRRTPLTTTVGEGLAADKCRACRIAAVVRKTNRWYAPFVGTCMAESLALWYLLRRRHIDAVFRLGVRTLTGRFESHAWVEYAGIVLNDAQNVAAIYEPFDLSGLHPEWRP